MSISEPVAIDFKHRDQSAEVFFNTLIRRNSNLELIMAVLPKKGSGSGYGKGTYTMILPTVCPRMLGGIIQFLFPVDVYTLFCVSIIKGPQ